MKEPSERRDKASLEAARWLVALDDEPDDADLRRRFQAWLDASPAHATAWADTCDTYGLIAETQPVHLRQGQEAPPPPSRVRRWRTACAGAVLALAACLAIVAGPGPLTRLLADEATTVAEVRAVGLDDGSIVRLAPDSAIDVSYGGDARRVRLLRGEAFFEVRPDATRPFRVVAESVETTVLGTSFNVRIARDGPEVSVRTGLVRVDDPSARPPVAERLTPGDWVRVAANGHVERGAIPPDEVAPWLHGQIVARDRPMADIVDELRRYYGGAIVVADGALRGRRVTGVYNLADPAAALRAIVGAHGGAVRQVSPWLLVAY
jgi:transmembrane sensor